MHLQELAPEIVGWVLVKWYIFIFFNLRCNECWIVFCPIPKTPYYSSILTSVFVNEAPRALIAKTKSNQSQGREATLLKNPTFLPCVQVPMGGSMLQP